MSDIGRKEALTQQQRGLKQLCRKDRLLEIIHDFIVFDAGTKKTCRHNQYFGVRATQQHVKRREGGIIWHTQGPSSHVNVRLRTLLPWKSRCLLCISGTRQYITQAVTHALPRVS